MNLLDRIRAMFRRQPRARNYDGAAKGRALGSWRATTADADGTLKVALPELRRRSRDLVRNNPHATKAVQVLTGNLVGTGIAPRTRTGDPDIDLHVDDLFERWSTECQTEGPLDFYGLQALAVRCMVESGEVLVRRRLRLPQDGLPVGLQLQILEPDHLDSTRNEVLPNGGWIIQGVEFDPVGRRAAYWLFRHHPGSSLPGTLGQTAQRVPADEILHLYEPLRPGQTRGVPWMAPVISTLYELGEYRQAEALRKKLEACYVGVVNRNTEGEDPEAPAEGLLPTVVDSDGNVQETMEPGTFVYAPGEIKFNTPTAIGGYVQHEEAQLRAVAAGLRVPYELMSGDLSKVNFSSSRVGLNEYRRFVEQIQWQCIIPMFCTHVWQWFVSAARAQELLPMDIRIGVEWQPPAFQSVNPLQDANAARVMIRSGVSTLSRAIAETGYNPRGVLEERRADDALLDEFGIILDSDPRRTALAGTAQDYLRDPANAQETIGAEPAPDGEEPRARRIAPLPPSRRLAA